MVFNVAGQVSHHASMIDPLRDLELNVRSHLAFLETLRAVAPRSRIVLTSTRQVYGRPERIPVDELHPTKPVDVNGVDKLACEQFHLLYGVVHGFRPTVLRLTNVYGPRQNLQKDDLGALPVFLRRAIRDEPIRLYGTGMQRRDCLHVDDIVRALGAATGDGCVGEIINLGHERSWSLVDIVSTIIELADSSSTVELVPWPEELARIDIGDFQGDWTKAAELLDWKPSVELTEGVRRHPAVLRAEPVVPVVDLSRRLASLLPEYQLAVARILQSGHVLLGPELEAFEAEFAAFVGQRFVVGVCSGAGALQLVLATLDLEPGRRGAGAGVHRRAHGVGGAGRRRHAPIRRRRRRHGDRRRRRVGGGAHRAHPGGGAGPPVRPAGRRPGHRSAGARRCRPGPWSAGAGRRADLATAYSFYPTKNLGGMGDGGALATDDEAVAVRIRRLRVHGMAEQYVHVEQSQNFRMSELEAAWLRLALPRAPGRERATAGDRARPIARRRPHLRWQADHPDHVHHLAVMRREHRDEVRSHLAARGVSSAVHYPLALTQQPAYRQFATTSCPEAERGRPNASASPVSPS